MLSSKVLRAAVAVACLAGAGSSDAQFIGEGVWKTRPTAGGTCTCSLDFSQASNSMYISVIMPGF